MVGILLALFLGSFGGPLFYYGLDEEYAIIVLVVLIVGWLLTYIYIGLFVLIFVKTISVILVILKWSKSDELRAKQIILANYL
ncbi:MAG: hypothetical protein ACK5M0_02575 [Bacteroidales bacterium]